MENGKRTNSKIKEMMETRKVQLSGNSTYLITLPKKWVERVRLKTSDSIGLVPLSNRTLLINPINLINPETGSSEDEKPGVIVYSSSKDLDDIHRRFIGAYLMGHNVIRFNSQKILTRSDREIIKKLSHSVMGTEIVDETSNSMTIKDLLGKGGFSIKLGVKRMQTIAQSMYRDAISALKTGDKMLMEDVQARDEDIDKFYWMVAKQYNFISRDIYFADKMVITPQEAMGYLLVARSIERFADHASKVAHFSKNIDPKVTFISKITRTSNDILDLFNDGLEAFTKGDFEKANRLLDSSKEYTKRLDKLNKEVLSLDEDPKTLISLVYVLDSLERSLSYALEIAETAVNHHFVKEYQHRSFKTVNGKMKDQFKMESGGVNVGH